MACSKEFIEWVCDILAPMGEICCRKMMGDYVIYVNGKCVISACDNIVFIKKLPCIENMMAGAECACPYPGAKEAYILDFSDARKALKVIEVLWNNMPFPKSGRK